LTQADILYRLFIAIAIGLLIGLQREHAHQQSGEKTPLFAGARTYPLLSMVGFTGAFLAAEAGSVWPLVTSLLLAGGLVVAVYVATAWQGELGMTSEVAAVLTMLAGALSYYDQLVFVLALGVTVMALLAMRGEIHRLAGRITQEDIVATLKFGIITAVVLPVVPSASLGAPPFDVLNPHKIWLMVVLISGISFVGYLLIKVVGARRGIGITGFLGGLVSSTAVTLSFSQRSKDQATLARVFAVAILVAWATMFARVIAEVAVVNRGLLDLVWIPMVAAGGTGLIYAAFLFMGQSSADEERMDFSNPFELGPALTFGALYAVILLVARVAQMQFGDGGIYVSSVLAGLTDVDAITLTMAELSQPGGEVTTGVASTAVTLAAMSNTVVKAGIVFSTGSPHLRKVVLPGFLLILAAGLGATFIL
jgi:uncharacterized membrane protein (DUF4010 family)